MNYHQINGCISTGKEANVYYCANNLLPPDPNSKSSYQQLALKVSSFCSRLFALLIFFVETRFSRPAFWSSRIVIAT